MAKIKKLTLDGATIYPVTIAEAIKDRASNTTLAWELSALAALIGVRKGDSETIANAAIALTSMGEGYNNVVALATTLKDFLTNATDSDTVINKWKEVEAFLSGITETQNLTGLLQQNLNSAKSYTDTEIDKIEKSIGNDKTSESEDGSVWGKLKSLADDITGHSVEIEALEEIKANYVTTDTEQTIDGNKNFKDGLEICGTQISKGGYEDRPKDLGIGGSLSANEFNIGQWSWLGGHFYYDGIDKEQIDLPEKSGTVALVEDIPGTATQSVNGLMSAADKKKLDAFGAATTYLTAAACNDVTDYPEITI